MNEAGAAHPVRRPRRARSRAGLAGLGVGVLLALVFTVWPELDLWASGLCVDPRGGFIGNRPGGPLYEAVQFGYRWFPRWAWAGFLAGIFAATIRHRKPDWIGPRWRSRLGALACVSLLGSGLVVNQGLKEYWGRARPAQVAQFGGTRHFTPALLPSDQCTRNCSFTSGHAAAGFLLMSAGLFAPVAARRRWLIAGLALGTLASAGRLLQGGHFLSDTLFSGWLVWASGWMVREAWLRIAARRRRCRRALSKFEV